MAKIISIGTAVPAHQHKQEEILQFMQRVYAMNETDKRKLKFLYHQSGIQNRYSVISDYSKPVNEWKFYPHTENLEPFPSLELRMGWFNKYAAPLSVDAIRNCIEHKIHSDEITHLITVSCTGMSAPGLDLQVMELMDLPKNIYRSSVNFMGCYAAIHALKMANSICNNEKDAKVLIVCTELCTLHFQREGTIDNITSSMLFGDGSAAVLVTHDSYNHPGLVIKDFYSEIISKGKKDMAWELSSSGFLMTLSGYIPELIEEDFEALVNKSLLKSGIKKEAVDYWCIHPGGKRILEAIHKSLQFTNGQLKESYKVLNDFGNMSSPTILFVLKAILQHIDFNKEQNIFGAAFGPGLTMETFVASTHA
ncbi:MAG: type III polyketide synthase [Sphingobacteriales bacterium]|nr:MAG: type III polyketide synthase [Sphingobacteriales bacterium]